MATITDTILRADGTPVADSLVSFAPLASPWLTTTGATSGGAVVAVTDAAGVFSEELRAGDYQVTWRIAGVKGGFNQTSIRVPYTSDSYSMQDLVTAFDEALQTQILAWTEGEQFQLANEAAILTSTEVSWPDGASGVWTCTLANETFGVPDAFTISYFRGGWNLTVTQAAVTRDDEGTITGRPALTIA